jgi:hypothetical protein
MPRFSCSEGARGRVLVDGVEVHDALWVDTDSKQVCVLARENGKKVLCSKTKEMKTKIISGNDVRFEPKVVKS